MPYQAYLIAGIPVLLAIIFAVYAGAKVRSVFVQCSNIRPQSGMTGYDAARRVLNENGLSHVRIERIAGSMTDHFDPRSNTVRLSETVYGISSAAAVGVAAHEAGHAIQYARRYFPLKLRNAIIPVTNIGSRLSTPLILLGIILAAASYVFIYVAYAGLLCFGFSVLFQLLTLPTEFNASKRALKAIQNSEILTPEETAATKRVLSAAAMTYVAATLVAFTQFMRLFLLINNRRR